MRLFLDANIFCRDYRLGGSLFASLLRDLDAIPAKLLISEVVVDEVCNRFREELIEQSSAAAKNLERMGRLLGRPVGQDLAVLDPHREADDYRSFLRRILTEVGAEFVPYPTVDHQTVVRRELDRKKPSGYRDILIWESLKSIARHSTEDVVFVTANSKDFGTNNRLHSDLEAEVPSVRLYADLQAFNDENITPQQSIIRTATDKIYADSGIEFDAKAWVNCDLLQLLRSEEMVTRAVGTPFFNRVSLLGMNRLLSIDEIEVRETITGSRAIRFGVAANFDIEVETPPLEQLMPFRLPYEDLGMFSTSAIRGRFELRARVEVALTQFGREKPTELLEIAGPSGFWTRRSDVNLAQPEM